MISFMGVLKKGVFLGTTFLAGLCLVMLLFFTTARETALKPDFHKKLFLKNHIYSITEKALDQTVSNYIAQLGQMKNNDSIKKKELLEILRKSITSESVKHNLDSVREELFQYLCGQRKFLPDIRLNTQPYFSGDNLTGYYNGNPIPLDSISGIDKISLSAILQYVNRDDINNYILILKLVYYTVSTAPGFLLLALLLLTLIGLVLSKKVSETLKWLSYTLLQFGLLSIALFAALLAYAYAALPNSIYPLEMTLPLGNNVILDYIRDCMSPLLLALIAAGILSILSSLLLLCTPRFLKKFFIRVKKQQQAARITAENGQQNKKHHFNNIVYIALLAVITIGLGFKLYHFKHAFDQNDFSSALSYLRNANAVTQVIAAKDEAVYTLQVKAVDSNSEEPMPDIKINVSGKSIISGKDYNITQSTDATGVAKFNLDKGNFRLSYLSSDFPVGFQIPAPYFFELKTAGTTIITSSLTESEKGRQKTGIAEIEVLDENSNPVPGLELEVLGSVSAEGYPDYIYSYTGSDGIATFKISEGNYSISFVKSKFSSQFTFPSPLSIDVKPDSVSRYTIRLVKDSQ